MENFHSHPIPVHKPYPNTQTAADVLVEVLLGAQDLSSQLSHALEQALSRRPDVEKVDLLRRSVLLGTQLKNAASRLWREYDTSCNSINWPLSHDLTIKIFSQVGIYSLSQAAASCNLFKKVAMESACYREIDLTDQNLRVNNSTVAKLIKRAGQCLRSLKLGSPTNGNKEDHATCSFDSAWTAVSGNIFLTKSCLEPLFVSGGAVGLLLQTLHLQNIVELDSRNVCKAIAACPGLMDLQIIGLHINERKVLRSVSMFCHKLTHLCLESPRPDFSSSWLSYSMRTVSCSELVNGCPNISSLSLRGFKLPDQKVKLLLKGLHHLSEADFSGADMLTGSFLRDLASSSGQKLRSLKLCDCSHLRAVEVNRLLSSLSVGECKNLRHLDVSNKDGLVCSDWMPSRLNINEGILLLVRMERPEIELRADFSDEKSTSECDSMSLTSSFGYCEYSVSPHINYHTGNLLSEGSQSMKSSSTRETDTELDTDDDDDDDDDDDENVDDGSDDGDDDDGDNYDDAYHENEDDHSIECHVDLPLNDFADTEVDDDEDAYHENEDDYSTDCHIDPPLNDFADTEGDDAEF